MKLVYVGPNDAVEVAVVPGLIAERGKPVEIPDDVTIVVNVIDAEDGGDPQQVQARLVDSLLEQSVWEKAGGTKASKEAEA